MYFLGQGNNRLFPNNQSGIFKDVVGKTSILYLALLFISTKMKKSSQFIEHCGLDKMSFTSFFESQIRIGDVETWIFEIINPQRVIPSLSTFEV